MSDLLTGTVLDRILARTREDLEKRKRSMTAAELRSRANDRPFPVDVMARLRTGTVGVIAEIKRASPSKGRFPVEIDPSDVARDYVAGGAAMMSCLTDDPFFQGSLADLATVVEVADAAAPRVGVLCKDFVIDRFQIDEAGAYGASCILLIVAALDDARLNDLHDYARSHGLAALVEVHDEEEAERAQRIGATLVGINNRSLKTLDVDLSVTEKVASGMPDEVVLVGESGISGVADVDRMVAAGADAVLIGESLIVDPRRVDTLRALASISSRRERRGR